MIDTRAILSSKLRNVPFGWSLVKGSIPKIDMISLAKAFPTERFCETSRQYGSDKTYRSFQRVVIAPGSSRIQGEDTLAPNWVALIKEFMTRQYRQAIAQLTQIPLENDLLEVVVSSYRPGCWLSPHTDTKHKTVTHLYYFHTEWKPEWGGCLQLFRSNNLERPYVEVPPLMSHSVVLVRSNHSWHAVRSVPPEVSFQRFNLQVVFWNEMPPPVKEGRVTRAVSPFLRLGK